MAAGSAVLAASVVCFVSIAWRADSVVLRDRKVVLVASLTKEGGRIEEGMWEDAEEDTGYAAGYGELFEDVGHPSLVVVSALEVPFPWRARLVAVHSVALLGASLCTSAAVGFLEPCAACGSEACTIGSLVAAAVLVAFKGALLAMRPFLDARQEKLRLMEWAVDLVTLVHGAVNAALLRAAAESARAYNRAADRVTIGLQLTALVPMLLLAVLTFRSRILEAGRRALAWRILLAQQQHQQQEMAKGGSGGGALDDEEHLGVVGGVPSEAPSARALAAMLRRRWRRQPIDVGDDGRAEWWNAASSEEDKAATATAKAGRGESGGKVELPPPSAAAAAALGEVSTLPQLSRSLSGAAVAARSLALTVSSRAAMMDYSGSSAAVDAASVRLRQAAEVVAAKLKALTAGLVDDDDYDGDDANTGDINGTVRERGGGRSSHRQSSSSSFSQQREGVVKVLRECGAAASKLTRSTRMLHRAMTATEDTTTTTTTAAGGTIMTTSSAPGSRASRGSQSFGLLLSATEVAAMASSLEGAAAAAGRACDFDSSKSPDGGGQHASFPDESLGALLAHAVSAATSLETCAAELQMALNDHRRANNSNSSSGTPLPPSPPPSEEEAWRRGRLSSDNGNKEATAAASSSGSNKRLHLLLAEATKLHGSSSSRDVDDDERLTQNPLFHRPPPSSAVPPTKSPPPSSALHPPPRLALSPPEPCVDLDEFFF